MGSPSGDLFRGTQLAKMIVEVCGMSQLAAPLRVFRDEKGDREVISGVMAESIDRQINTIVAEAQAKAAKVLADHKDELVSLRDELIKDKTIEPARVADIIKSVRKKYAAEFAAMGAAPLTPEEDAAGTRPEEKTPHRPFRRREGVRLGVAEEDEVAAGHPLHRAELVFAQELAVHRRHPPVAFAVHLLTHLPAVAEVP